MIPKTIKIFISYRSTDSAKVDPLVHRLRSMGYQVWQDKDSIPAGQDWWEAICEGIMGCDVFIFMLSTESVKSFACLAELSYAHELNLPIIPFVIEGQWTYNAGGKYDISFWSDIPDELNESRAQILFYEGVSFVDKLKQGIDTLLAKNKPRFPATPPPDPRHVTDATNNVTVIYDEAYDFAYRGELEHAKKLFRKLVNYNDAVFGTISLEWVHIIEEYTRIRDMAAFSSTRKIAGRQWSAYTQQFPKDFMDGIFDPANIEQLLAEKPAPSAPTKPTATADVVRALIGEPFEWRDVPAGEFLYGDNKQKLTLPAFAIAKYPITYRQFQTFIDAKDGFKDKRWWQGLAEDQSNESGDQQWKIDDRPRENVSWYDAIAFCRWLSFKLGGGYNIDRVDDWLVRLPTEYEWEKSARGTDGRAYPYGNTFDKTKCNTEESGIGKTTPVTKYPQGASPYGVLDMSGNVWEWCLTDYNNPASDAARENVRSDAWRVLRGGSWVINQGDARAACRGLDFPDNRDFYVGFRLVRAPSL